MPRPRLAPRIAAPALAALAAPCLVAPGCAVGGAGDAAAIHTWTMRERIARVEPGQRADAARAILGDAPVRKPGHPGEPFASPRRVLELTTPAGQAARVEIYVVGAQPAEGCPDVQWEDVPVVFVDGVVAGTGWAWVERSWRAWGGSLAALRDAQDRRRCAQPPAAAPGAAPAA